MDAKHTILSTLYGTGLDQLLLRGYDALRNTTGDIAPEIREFEGPEDPKGTVVFPMIPGYRTVCYRYCVLADALRRRGYEPVLLVDDGALDAPLARTVDQTDAGPAQADYFGRRIPAKFGLETTSVSDLLVDVSEPITVDESVSDVERFARASTKKFLKRYTLDLDDPDVAATYDSFLKAGVRLDRAVKTLLDHADVVALVAHEPYYVQGGIPMQVADAYGVPAHSQVMGFRPEHLIFGQQSNRSSLAQYTDDRVLERALSTPLSGDEVTEIEKIMSDRASGVDTDTDYSAHTGRTVDEASEGPVVGVFTNLLWDASIEPDQALYGDVFTWLDDTLAVAAERPETTFVVKAHPAEALLGTNESVTGWFADRDEVPDNVTVLPPDTDVDTYALLDSLDAAIVYNSTVGLEAAFREVPTVVAGETHYRDCGLTFDPESRAAYRERIATVDEASMDESMVAAARRYAHFLFVKKHVPFPFCRREQSSEQQLRRVEADSTAPGVTLFDSVTSAITDGRAVLSPEYDHLSRG